MKLYCEHRIARSAEDLWQVLHTPEFEMKLGRAIGLSQYRDLERSEDDRAIYRRIRVLPTIPAPLEGLLRRFGAGESVSYIEEQWRSKREKAVRWKMIPSVLADRVRIQGVIRIEPVDDRTCLRVLDGEVVVRFPGLARTIEQAIVKGAVEAYGKSAAVAGADR